MCAVSAGKQHLVSVFEAKPGPKPAVVPKVTSAAQLRILKLMAPMFNCFLFSDKLYLTAVISIFNIGIIIIITMQLI